MTKDKSMVKVDGLFYFEPNIGAESDEPCLRSLIWGYYSQHFGNTDKARSLTDSYISKVKAHFKGKPKKK